MNRRYLWYVLLHKWYVFRAGLVIGPPAGRLSWVPWLWRLLVHDWSKFRPSEWRAYARYFYGTSLPPTKDEAANFQRAWLAHLHRNPHHWQHWILHTDGGKTLVLTPPADVVLEMVADWVGAGMKILKRPSLVQCVAETLEWYGTNRLAMQLRERPRTLVEETLIVLADRYGLIPDRTHFRQTVRTELRTTLANPHLRA